MSKNFKIYMFITSFLPLWLSIIFMDFISIFYMKANNIKTEIISIIIILVLLIISMYKILKIRNIYDKKVSHSIYISDINIEKKLTTEHLLSYVLPLFAFDFTLWYDCVKFLIYFLSILLLCVKNDNVYINIFLEIMGYKVYSCKAKFNTEENYQIYIISKEIMVFKNGHILNIIELNKPFYFYKNYDKK